MSFDPRPYVDGILARNEAERAAVRSRTESAMREARLLAEGILRADPDVKAVILFGSLAEGGPKRLDFDIDLALDGGDAYKAMDVTEESSFDVDVVSLRLLPPHVRERIAAKGIVLARRDSLGAKLTT